MAFWSAETLRERARRDTLIAPFNGDRVAHGAYELSLGSELFITSEHKTKRILHRRHQVLIPPGQFGLLITQETIRIPVDAIGLLSVKTSIKFGGLVNVSGFHVDPGFHGKLKFSVYNAGSRDVPLEVGAPTFLLWFVDLDRATAEPYRGQHQDQNSLTARDVSGLHGEIASPGSLLSKIDNLERDLAARIDRLDDRVKFARNATIGVVGGFIAALAVALIVYIISNLSGGGTPSSDGTTNQPVEPLLKPSLGISPAGDTLGPSQPPQRIPVSQRVAP